MAARVRVYRDDQGEWRWAEIAGNNEIVAQGEGYKNEADAIERARKQAHTPDGIVPVVVERPEPEYQGEE